MDRAERIGLTASAAGHGGLIVLALVGGLFSHEDVSLPTVATEVSLISSEQFAALQAAAPTAETESPPVPSPPQVVEEAEAAEPAEEAPPETAQPEAELPPDPEDAPLPDASPVEPAPLPMPEVETPSETVLEEINPAPRPTDAGRVAPEPSDEPAPDAQPSDTVVTETAPVPDEAAPEEEVVEEQAPEEATTQTPVENEVAEVTQSSAPLTSIRPKGRPEKPVEQPEPEPAPETELAANETPAEEPPAEQTDEAVDAALAEALSGAASEEPAPGTGVAASGPPMTSGEKDALVVAVKQCWNVGALSTDALRTVVTVGVTMGQDGMPDTGSIRMIGYEGGDDRAAQQAFEAGRRAIIRCARGGYPLPPEKYDQWRELEIVFNPENMRMR